MAFAAGVALGVGERHQHGGARDGGIEQRAFFALHLGGAIARRLDAERTELPDWLADDVALDVLAADERNVVAELGDEQVDQAAAVHVLLGRHFGEHLGGRGIVLAQALGEVAVDAPVLFLVGDRQREHLALGKIVEIARHRSGPRRVDETVAAARPAASAGSAASL